MSINKRIEEMQKKKEIKGFFERLGIKKEKETKPIQKPQEKKLELLQTVSKKAEEKPKAGIKTAVKPKEKKVTGKAEKEKIIMERIPIDKLKKFVSKGRFAFSPKKKETKEKASAKKSEEKSQIKEWHLKQKTDIGKE